MKKIKSNILISLFFIVVFTLIALITFSQEFSFYDENWCFQNIYKMYNNGVIYNDNNVIDTPIFFVVGNILFHILNANLFTFRIYNVLIFFLQYLLIYLIFRKLGSNKVLSSLYLVIWIIFDEKISCGANYNILAISFVLLGILWYISNYEKKNYHFMQGIIIFLTFFTKQTIGVYYAFGIILFELLDTGFNKTFFKNQFSKLATFLPFLLFSLLFMFFRGNLINFINLCFGSIFEFGSSNIAFYLSNWPSIAFISISITFSFFVLIKIKNIQNEIKRNIKFLLCIAIGLLFNMFPLANTYHINMSLTFYVLLFVYILDALFIREIFTTKSQNYTLVLISFIILYLLFIKLGYNYFSDTIYMKQFDKNHPFFNAPIAQEHLDKINTITQYITIKQNHGTKVLVLSYEAGSYMIPAGINNNEFDMLLSGNMGYHGTQKTIEKISNMKDTEFLILSNEEDCFWQEPVQIREYIINNFKKTKDFLNYSIYINK